MNCSKKVVLTGSTGLIGKEAINPLKELGYEVHCLTSENCNLFDSNEVKKFLENIKPEYLLHFAWFTGQGYLESDLNYKFLDSSLEMLKYFKEYGGKKTIFAGTCFEYKFKDSHLKEDDELNPETIYAKCKNNLHQKAAIYCKENDIDFGWGRIFYVYGHEEYKERLTAYLIKNLTENKETTINCGNLIKDYIYTKDIAGAFAKFLDSEVCGCVNICTGQGISIKDYAEKIAQKLDKMKYLNIKQEKTNQPHMIIGDNKKLTQKVRYTMQYTLDEAIDEILGRRSFSGKQPRDSTLKSLDEQRKILNF